MVEKIFTIYTSIISIIGFFIQLTEIDYRVKNAILIISIFSLLALIIISLIPTNVVNRKKMIKMGNSIIYSTKEKLILFGGDLSWAKDYIEAIKVIHKENKIIEIYFPESKYINCDDNSEFLNRIILLREAGANIYSFKKDLGLRCILIDPDTYTDADNMQIIITDRIYRNIKNPIKNKYNVRYLRYANIYHKNICKSYIANYNYVKENTKTY